MNTLANPMDDLAGADDEAVIVAGGGEPVEVGQDGPFDWYVPASAAEFTALDLLPPQILHLMQDTSGGAADEFGVMPLTAANGVTFQNSVSGWTARGVGFDGSTAKQSLYAVAGEGWDLSDTACAWLVYYHVNALSAAAAEHFLLLGTADPDTNQSSVWSPAGSSDVLTFRSENVNVSGVYDVQPSELALLFVRLPGSTSTTVYTFTGSAANPLLAGGDRIVGNYAGTLDDGYKCIGSIPVASGSPLPANFTAHYSAIWTGADAVAQFGSHALVKTFFEKMNIAPLWYVAVDGPTHKLFPGAADEWAVVSAWQELQVGRAMRDAARVSAWTFQETASPILDKIGSTNLTTVFATLNAAIGITGYTRKCASWTGGGSNGQAAVATGPDLATEDVTLVGFYTTIVAVAALRQVMMLGGSATGNEVVLNINSSAGSSALQAKAGTDTTDDSSGFVAATPMRIYAVWTASTKTLWIYTKDRKFSITTTASLVAGAFGFGARSIQTPAFKLAHAHRYSVALTAQEVHDEMSLLDRLTPSWSP